jgi:hypothetical protein
MPHFEPYIPIFSLYPVTVSIIMADPLARAIRTMPEDARLLITAADEAAQQGLATNFPVVDKQIDFVVRMSNEIVRAPYFLITELSINTFLI